MCSICIYEYICICTYIHIYDSYLCIHEIGIGLGMMFQRYFLMVKGLREVWLATTVTRVNCLLLENGAGDPSFRDSLQK